MFDDVYSGKKVLITGDTGFKGSWLKLWLTEMGAEVFGLSKDTHNESTIFINASRAKNTQFADIREPIALERIFQEVRPEIIFHLAAQAIVSVGYQDPLETWSTNVQGTANVLEAARKVNSIKALIVVTSDKCYLNDNSGRFFCESDPLGGHDPYSASKAAAEILTASYRESFFQFEKNQFIATARAGNVIGGGDWSVDRLVPDIFRAYAQGLAVTLRAPNSTRPWQHVLEPLSGYLLLGQKLLQGQSQFASAWNFGPTDFTACTVSDLAEMMGIEHLSIDASFGEEAKYLQLDSSKARQELGWEPVWTTKESAIKTKDWYESRLNSNRDISLIQLNSYFNSAKSRNSIWVR